MASVPGHRIIAGVITTLAVALAGASPSLAADNPPFNDPVFTAADVQCSEIIVYASRGANENSDFPSKRAPGQFEADGVTPRTKYYEGLGEELLPIYSAFRDKYAPGTISLVTNRAPKTTKLIGGTDRQGPSELGFRSVGVTFTLSAFYDYALSINEGRRAAIRDLNLIHQRCPGSKLVLMGYSAGAEVTRRALASLTWTPEPGKAMAIIFGDPTWKPREPNLAYVGDVDATQLGSIRVARDGDFGFKISIFGFSISSIPSFPPGWNATTYCHGGDMSCQYRGGLIFAHETYHSEDDVGAANRIAGYLGGRFVEPVITARINSTATCYRRGSIVNTTFKVEGVGPSDVEVIKAQWEATPFVPFEPIALAGPSAAARRSFVSGLFSRLRIEVDGHKLDYRNVC